MDKAEQDAVIERLAELLREATPLAELVNSDDYSDEQRAQLRKLVGTRKYVELPTNLNQMTGWRVRDAARRRQ